MNEPGHLLQLTMRGDIPALSFLAVYIDRDEARRRALDELTRPSRTGPPQVLFVRFNDGRMELWQLNSKGELI